VGATTIALFGKCASAHSIPPHKSSSVTRRRGGFVLMASYVDTCQELLDHGYSFPIANATMMASFSSPMCSTCPIQTIGLSSIAFNPRNRTRNRYAIEYEAQKPYSFFSQAR